MSAFLDEVESIRETFIQEVSSLNENETFEDLKNRYLGRNGKVSLLMKTLGKVPKDLKAKCGKEANLLKQEISKKLDDLSSQKAEKEGQSEEDYSLPGRYYPKGNLHPLRMVDRQICSFFKKMGFSIVEGPEVESDENNFTALNIPDDHPSRDMHDTFYLQDIDRLLRTHTSPVQIRVMKEGNPPFRVIAPGRVYRCDSDITHSPMFHQIEGLAIGKEITFANLKFILEEFAKSIFDSSVKLRFRPSYFPFTEPSAEIDVSCVMCQGKGCRVCSQTGWLEILGAGMVDPQVLINVGIDPELYGGYAFGMGVERIAMLKFGINDIRLFTENHLDFLRQFDSPLSGGF